jgi:hypothetical protein
VAPSALRFFPSSPSARFAAANPLPPRRVLPILSLRAGSLPMSTNVGVHDGAPGAAVDAAFARRALQAEALLGYLSALATSPRAGGDRVDPAVTAAQLGRSAGGRARRGAFPSTRSSTTSMVSSSSSSPWESQSQAEEAAVDQIWESYSCQTG